MSSASHVVQGKQEKPAAEAGREEKTAKEIKERSEVGRFIAAQKKTSKYVWRKWKMFVRTFSYFVLQRGDQLADSGTTNTQGCR